MFLSQKIRRRDTFHAVPNTVIRPDDNDVNGLNVRHQKGIWQKQDTTPGNPESVGESGQTPRLPDLAKQLTATVHSRSDQVLSPNNQVRTALLNGPSDVLGD